MNANQPAQRDHNIQLIDKVACLIEVLRHRPNGLSLDETATRAGYVKSTVHRILQSLKKHSFVEQDGPGGLYRLGFQFQLIARGLNNRNSIVQLARPFLIQFVAAWSETAYLAVVRGDSAVFLDVEEGQRDLRLVGPMSAEVHFHATAAGKAIAAFMPDESRKAILAALSPERLTGRTLTSAEEIEQDWGCIRRRGYALNDEETIPGAVFVAAPLFDTRGTPCGSLSVGIPKSRCSDELIGRMAPELIEACRQLTLRIEAAGLVFTTVAPHRHQ
jgi:IclR family acetate operon transcriptional repressor